LSNVTYNVSLCVQSEKEF